MHTDLLDGLRTGGRAAEKALARDLAVGHAAFLDALAQPDRDGSLR
jgi:hypothetical protein